MNKVVHIFGCEGNMGHRYRAILNSLTVGWTGSDFDGPTKGLDPWAADAFLICTPTECHLGDIEGLLGLDKPILCEKPLTTDLVALEAFVEKHHDKLHLLTMVDQYSYMPLSEETDDVLEPTIYNYFKSGKDTLAWDCINIVGKANNAIILNNYSPVWECMINGTELSIADMDHAYVAMIDDWLRNPRSNLAYALMAHRKVKEYLECHPS